jgi:bifunctional non-homologous end joining protein LigD
VRVFSRTGHEWGAQLPAIAAALRALPVRSVILDGEGVICGPDGVSDFDRMRAVFGRKGSPDVFLYAFDVLEMDGHDLRAQSWDTRRALLTQLLDRCQEGLRLSEHVEDTDGAVVFRQACVMGLEGIVDKRRDSRYRSGRCHSVDPCFATDEDNQGRCGSLSFTVVDSHHRLLAGLPAHSNKGMARKQSLCQLRDHDT